jgi:hypothetical protein
MLSTFLLATSRNGRKVYGGVEHCLPFKIEIIKQSGDNSDKQGKKLKSILKN